MVKIDVPKLRGKMVEKGFTITSMAEKLGINRNTLSSYLETPEKTPYIVVSNLAEMLCDTVEEANSIFFAHDLRKT